MTDVLGLCPVAIYEQPILINSIRRPQSAQSLPVTQSTQNPPFTQSAQSLPITPRDFNSGNFCELCNDAVSTTTMDSVQSYPTLAVTRSDSHSLHNIVSRLQLKQEMERYLKGRELYQPKRFQKRHRHAWKEKQRPNLQKPVWPQRTSTNEFAPNDKSVESKISPRPNGVKTGFWKTMTSPTPGEQNLKAQQKKQSGVHKRSFDPDRINMSIVMKRVNIKNSQSAREDRRKAKIDDKELGRKSAPSNTRQFALSTEKRAKELQDLPSPYSFEFRNSPNYRRQYQNMLIERALEERKLPIANQKPRQILPSLSSAKDDDIEIGAVNGHDEDHAQVDVKILCKSARPITDQKTTRKYHPDVSKLEIQSKALAVSQDDDKTPWSREYHVQGDRDTMTTGRYTSALIRYDKNQYSNITEQTKSLKIKQQHNNEQSVSVQMLTPFETENDLSYQQHIKFGLRHHPHICRHNSYMSDLETTRTPANTPAPELDLQSKMYAHSVDEITGHPTMFHDKSQSRRPSVSRGSEPKTKIDVFLPTVT